MATIRDIIRDKKLLALALEWKANPKHAADPEFRYKGIKYDYEKEIFPSARYHFPKYNLAYKDNQDFAEAFTRDLYRKNAELIAEINKGAKTPEEQIFYQEPAAQPESGLAAEQAQMREPAKTMMGGVPTPTITAGRVAAPRIIHNIPRAPEQKPQPETPSKRAIPRVPAAFTNVSKNLGSSAQIGIKNLLGGMGRAGGSMLGGLAGGGGRFFGKVGLGGAEALSNIGIQMSRGSFIKGPPAKFWLLFLGAFIFLVLGTGFISAPTTSTQQPPSGITPPTGNLASCQFTRGDRNPPAESYKSPLLLGYFQQASQISSVPAQVLAAIARVESPTITSKSDVDLPALSSIDRCPRSQTGALGIMQLQPPGTRGYIQPAIDKGASYLGKTADQLTEADFCDLRSNIIIASGFILKKLQGSYGIGDGNKWDPSWTNNRDVIYKLAEGYYGCLEYGGPDPLKCGGPHNYGDDIWTSIQSCKALSTFIPTSAPSRPTGDTILLIKDDILKEFNIDMDVNFPYDYMKWAWEKLWNVRNTKFLQLIGSSRRIVTVTRDDARINAQIGCSGIIMRGKSVATGQPYLEPLFRVVFIHELSHIIDNCHPTLSKKDQLPSIIAQEGYLTSYSQNANLCVGSNNLNEDYAETITYFLNPEYPEQSLGIGAQCEPTTSNNPYSRNKPLHQKFAQDLLL